jgi:hypothetical protein
VEKESNEFDSSAVEYSLRPNLAENVDYRVLNRKLWNALSHWYGGGPPIKRMKVEVFEVCKGLSFTFLLCFFFFPNRIASFSG